jgi:hypothetical protein
MKIVGDRQEVPVSLPNRTASAIADLKTIIGGVQLRVFPGIPDGTLFRICCEEFRKLHFSEVIKPMNEVVESEAVQIFHIYSTAIILSLREQENNQTILLILLFLIAKSFEQSQGTRTEAGNVGIPVTLTDIRTIIRIGKNRSGLAARVLREIHPSFKPVLKYRDLFIGHSGLTTLRDNLHESTAKELSLGEETTRTVVMQSIGQDDVGLFNAESGNLIFQLGSQTSHNHDLRRDCLEIVQSFGDIIPPPARSDPDVDPVGHPELAWLPPRDVRSLLRSGRIVTPRKKRVRL